MKQDNNLYSYTVPPKKDELVENQVVLCTECFDQIKAGDYSNSHYWRCLEGSIWSEVPAVQVLSYKILKKLTSNEWAMDAVDAVFLEESLIEWANDEDTQVAEKVIHKDANGILLTTGDNVILTQNLNVKGTSYIAPKGTMVRKVRLVSDNAEQLEGKINGDTIVILTKFVKKSV
ncbi:Alkylphosphonate utilization operon protein PhnA [Arcticibacter svalbardensis MN12-7]|uniref:Alkylphosphonate utilization operon protein PhnA n=2 Tax=Arcticibacter TaxID=1288026 RepID=R9GNA7_9SPHI|nr:Alkylphosphonate utilization operon protein PhnA [Arcticibacter svalbardensis MN12-7]